MGKSFWFRVLLLMISLVAVLSTIRYLNQSTPRGYGVLPKITGTFSLCPARITWIEIAGSLRIEEQAMKWFRTSIGGAERSELDPISVEKWLSRFCSALTRESTAGGMNQFATVAQVGYVTGPTQSLLKSKTSKEYLLDGHHFTSPDLDEALHTAPKLPTTNPPGTP